MKIFAQFVPTVPGDYSNEYFESNRAENEAMALASGYTGQYTGKLVRDPFADGYATYMVIDSGKSIMLMHMDWVDGYESRWASRWLKKDVIQMIERQDAMAKLFSRTTT